MVFLRCPVSILTAGLLLVAGCSEKTPSRDHIPILKERLYQLQQVVRARNRAVMDSLLSPAILNYGQSSDSLLRFCFSPDGSFAFEQFGNCDIAYTNNRALAECFVMDSTNRTDRPIRLTFVYEHDLWLLKRFEPGDTTTGSH